MSSGGSQVAVLGMRGQLLPERGEAISGEQPQLVRLLAFAALGLYGVARWSKLLTGGTHGRLVAILALALLLGGGRPVLARWSRVLAGVFTAVILVAALPIAGLPLHWMIHLRIAVIANAIGGGISSLPGVLVPYTGSDHWVRLDVILGGAVLLFDAALLLAFAPRAMEDLRRAGAVLPLVALVAVPSTLVHPRFPYLNGLLLFLMLAAFVLGDRISGRQASAAFGLCLITAMTAMLIAPSLDRHAPWVNYEALAGGARPRTVEVFNWNQTYGPVNWPHRGHTVLEIAARQPTYWKAEDLDAFDGHGWTEGDVLGATPAPSPSALATWSQTIQVTVRDMRTNDVIGAGVSGQPRQVPRPVYSGYSPGTWLVQGSGLAAGDSYSIRVYTPQPTPAQLSSAGSGYSALPVGYRTIQIPPRAAPGANTLAQVVFPPFHSGQPVQNIVGLPVSPGPSLIRSSAYGPAYRLAVRLARAAPTPYAFAAAVQRYLAQGFTYTQDPPVRAYPLESFLFTDKRGYCQQFAGAMALLLRMGGVPARVAVGFTQGRQDPATQRWLVTDEDAHAWVEAWFPRFGWVKFDPTPPVDPALRNLAPLGVTTGTQTGAGPAQNNRNGAAKFNAKTRGGGARRQHGHSDAGAWEGLAAGSALLAAALVLLWLATRPLRSTEDLVLELERALSRTRRPLSAEDTLAGLEERFRTAPAASQYVRTLRLARFGAGQGRPTPAQRRALRRQLGFRLGPLGKLRALWALPPRRRRPAPHAAAPPGA